MANATKIIKDWCASCGMPEPSDGECHALTVALAAAPAADATVTKDEATWCSYIAGIIGCYL